MASLDNLTTAIATLTADVAAENTAITQAIAEFKVLTDQIAVLQQQLQDAINANDPAAIQAAADSIKAANDQIVAQTEALASATPK